MSTRDDLLTAARGLLTAVGGVPAEKIAHAGAPAVGVGAVGAVRPAKPYVTVRLTSPGGGGAPAERIDSVDVDDTPQTRMRERREASVSIQGFGAGASAWLDALQLGLDSPASLAAQQTLGVAAVLLTPVRDLSEMVDTGEEARFLLELTLRYRLESTPADAVELLTAVISGDAERFDSDPSALPLDTTLSLA